MTDTEIEIAEQIRREQIAHRIEMGEPLEVAIDCVDRTTRIVLGTLKRAARRSAQPIPPPNIIH